MRITAWASMNQITADRSDVAVADSNATASEPERQSWNVAWHQGLRFRVFLAALLFTGWIAAGIIFVMNREAKAHLQQQSDRLVEQIGSTVVTGLNAQLDEIAALNRSLATVTQLLPKSEQRFMTDLPPLIDFGGDRSVAGGGFWPEPFSFEPNRERRSFFWGRNQQDQLIYFDGYNQPGPGYHNEEWYVPARFVPKDTCYWSQSYTDPYSFQPMVTCTVPVRDGNKLTGVTTIDMRLEGLANFAREWEKRTGGYIFLVDRYNRFITFADPAKVKRIGTDGSGNRTEEFILASELAASEPTFAEISAALSAMNADILSSARQFAGNTIDTVAKEIDSGSYQIDAAQATLTAAVLADPLKDRRAIERTNMHRTVKLSTDPVLKQTSTLFLFHVPGPYWKLGVVKPLAETVAVANTITRQLIGYLLATVMLVILIAYFLFNRWLLAPIAGISAAVRGMSLMISTHRHNELDQNRIEYRRRNEIGQLGNHINSLAHEVVTSEARLADANAMLERRVQARTEELAQRNTELEALNERLAGTQSQLLQSEKMASIGQLAAGVAHEINNPIAFVRANLHSLEGYVGEILSALEAIDKNQNEVGVGDAKADGAKPATVRIETRFLREDIPALLSESMDGATRIEKIVQDLKEFSHLDEANWQKVDLHKGIETTLSVATHELKYKIDVIRHYGELPLVECLPFQINQVLLNLIVNAAQSIEGHGTITLTTGCNEDIAWIRITDTGKGIEPAHLKRIFDPFFTTKPIGVGTGLGLSVSYSIMRRHGGSLEVSSILGEGTTFTASLPVSARKSGESAEQ